MSCDELLALMNDYVDGGIASGLCAEFERHLAGCNPCQVVIDNIRQTITLYKAGEPYPLPEAFRDHLHTALRARWQQSHLPAPPPPAALNRGSARERAATSEGSNSATR